MHYQCIVSLITWEAHLWPVWLDDPQGNVKAIVFPRVGEEYILPGTSHTNHTQSSQGCEENIYNLSKWTPPTADQSGQPIKVHLQPIEVYIYNRSKFTSTTDQSGHLQPIKVYIYNWSKWTLTTDQSVHLQLIKVYIYNWSKCTSIWLCI